MPAIKIKLRPMALWLICAAFAVLAINVVVTLAPAQSEMFNPVETVDQRDDRLGLPPLTFLQSAGRLREREALGKKLFFDRRMSFSGSMSCAMCHLPSQAFTTTTSRTSVGMEGRSLRRNAPTLLNVAWQRTLFHDGRETSLVTQAWMPLLHPDEMANPSIGYVLDRIASLDDYAAPFLRAFGHARPTMETVGAAIAAYESSLVSGNSRFDRWRYGADSSALSAEEQMGFTIFAGKGRCTVCHLIGPSHALLADNQFHNTGIAQRPASQQAFVVQLAPNVSTLLTDKDLRSFKQIESPDLGRYEITLRPEDRYAFKTPSLRNVARTAPYMHNGSIETLAEVVEFYNQGGGEAPGKSSILKPLALTAIEKHALVAFLGSLNGDSSSSAAVSDEVTPKVLARAIPAEE